LLHLSFPLKEDTRAKLLRVFQHFPYEVVVQSGAGVSAKKKTKKRTEAEAVTGEEKAVATAVRLNVNLIHVLSVAGASGKLQKKMTSYFFGKPVRGFMWAKNTAHGHHCLQG
jgi:hypothetical protein